MIVGAKHPGTVELVDEERGTTKSMAVKDVPPQLAFVDGRPVVKVIRSKRGTETVLRCYGEDGTLLSTTVGK
jgi:hypothetical protein